MASYSRSAASEYEKALRAILAVRLDTNPNLERGDVFAKARLEMRRIAEEALRDAK